MSVVKLEDGSLSYLIEVVVPGGIMNPGFLRIFDSITKQEYRELLAKAKANGFLEETGKHGQPTSRPIQPEMIVITHYCYMCRTELYPDFATKKGQKEEKVAKRRRNRRKNGLIK